MKQKQNELIVRIVIFLFALSFGLLGKVFAQYYYFTSSGEYQQGCKEALEIRIDSQGQHPTAGLFNLVLDPTTTIYPHVDSPSEIGDFFRASSETFPNYTSAASPQRQEGSDYKILEADRMDDYSYYDGTSGLYATFIFTPEFSDEEYDIVFSMEYIPRPLNAKTELGIRGVNIINSVKQIENMTGSFRVLKEPCVADTNKPTITDISFGSTKVSHLSGLTFWLKDEGGVNGTGNVPYIKTDGSPWTGNGGGIISNQYGIDISKFELKLSGNGWEKTITNTTPGLTVYPWNGRTWKNDGLNANITISPEGLLAEGLSGFGIEKTITGTFIFYDRAGNSGAKTIVFNRPKEPRLTGSNPGLGAVYVNLRDPIKLGIVDDWAGVNSGTIQITLFGVDGTDYGPYVFSGADLNLSGVQGEANVPDYYISISDHEIFPTSGTIKVSVYAKDMEGNGGIISNYKFSTRPNCSELQCCDPVLLDLGSGNLEEYKNTGLIISGGNNPTFSVDEQNITGVVDCNTENEGLSVYIGQDSFVFFTDDPVLTILGTGVKGVLSGDVLTLSYIIYDSYVIIDKPTDSERLSGGNVDIQWHLTGAEYQDDWLSGYVVQISGEDFNTGFFINTTGIAEILPDGEYEIIVYPVDVLGHTGTETTINFVVDITVPECSVEVLTLQCTNSDVDIKLSGNMDDIVTFRWWNGTTGNFGNNIVTTVGENGEYVGYVYDAAGNEGVCTGVVGTGIQDQILISYTIGDAEGFECEMITGFILGNTGDSCGKSGLDSFKYTWPGGIHSSEYGKISNNVSGYDVMVTVVDGAGNSTGATVKFTWNDTGVTLASGVSHDIGVLTGIFEKSVAEIIDLFGATEGACGIGNNITVTGGVCSGASISVNYGVAVSITPDYDLSGENYYCELEFRDDDGGKTTGNVVFKVDTQAPGVSLTGTNLVCMNTGTFDVTGMFTESMMGFDLGDVVVSGGTISSFDGNGILYTWKVHMDPMVETKVYIPAGVATDLNGNENIVSNELVGMYDNAGPNTVSLQSIDKVYEPLISLSWYDSEDNGCAGISGYYWEIYKGDCEGGIFQVSGFVVSGDSLSVNVDGLVNGNYCWRVQSVDNFGNIGGWKNDTFVVDLSTIGCVIKPVELIECTSGEVQVKLITGGDYAEGGPVYLSWISTGDDSNVDILYTGLRYSGQIVVGYISQPLTNKFSSCVYTASNIIDQVKPSITELNAVVVEECTTGTANISAEDEGCGNTPLRYKWNGSDFGENSYYLLWSGGSGSEEVSVLVRDNVGNITGSSVMFEWINSGVIAHDFTGHSNVGNTLKYVHWKDLSQASDGACGSGTLELFDIIYDGDHGMCAGGDEDIIIYVPDSSSQYEGNDSCTIRVKDDEYDWTDIKISWEGIDTLAPSCTLSVIDGQQCSSGNIALSLSSEEVGVTYSFDGEIFGNITTGYVNYTGIYTGYVKDEVGNTGLCTGIVDEVVLDLDIPTLEVSDWIGDECSAGTITVTGNDNSCGISGLYYGWEGFSANTGNTNQIYSSGVGTRVVNVSVFDGVGHITGKQVTYMRQNIKVTGSGFTVENVGTGITVDWFGSGNISGGVCELGEITASSNDGRCIVNGHNVTFRPGEGVEGGDSSVIIVSDQDGEDLEIVIIWTGIDTRKPTVTLQGGVGESCTDTGTFLVTGTFSEDVTGVTTGTLKGEYVQINNVEKINERMYQWTVEMEGGTGKVRINSGEVTDLIGNGNEGTGDLILGNYDNIGPSTVGLISFPDPGEPIGRTVYFEWAESNELGCAGFSGYKLQICRDSACTDIVKDEDTTDTGISLTLSENGVYYRIVNSVDLYGNLGTGVTGHFVVNSIAPSCFISQISACTTGSVVLNLTGNKKFSVISGNISWQPISQTIYTGEVSENIDVWAIVEDDDNQTGYCVLEVTNYDTVGPDFQFDIVEVDEGDSLIINIVAVDTGCAGISGYKFGDYFGLGDWQVSSGLSVSAEQIGKTGGVQKEQVITVVDTLGNSTTKTGIVKIKDVKPTIIQTGTVDSLQTLEIIVDVIDLLGASEGSCGTGDLKLEISNCVSVTGFVDGHNLVVSVSDNTEGTGYCTVRIRDNERSYSDVDGVIEFGLDSKKPECTSWYSIPSWTSGNSIMVYLTGCSEAVFGTTGRRFTSNMGKLFEYHDAVGNTGELLVHYTGFDREAPIFNFNISPVYECHTGIVRISGAIDSGIGLSNLPYSFDGVNWSTGNEVLVYSNVVTGIFVSGYVVDGLGNQNVSGIVLTFADAQPTASGFIVYALNGTDVNWKELSNASDGDCGNSTLTAIVTGGDIGSCTISGDILSYKPNSDYVTGSDNCELTIYDDEGSSVVLDVEITGINKYPYIKLNTPRDGDVQKDGEIYFSRSEVGDHSIVSGYVYRIWNTIYDKMGELTGQEFSIHLGDGAYNWYVYAIFRDGSTGGLSSVYSFNIIGNVPSGGGGGGVRLVKDKCPNGDFSDSYYDGTCDSNAGTHGSAGSDICGIDASNYSTEQKGAYLYSYMYGITTICPIQSANLDGYLIRSHFAKMISEFAVKVLGMKPEKGKKGCDKFDDIGKLSDELRYFVVTSCELGLMGLEPDGVTPSKSFNPNGYVTRAQFGTIFSRLLFGDKYNIKDGSIGHVWYEDHLKALKNYGIMTKVDGNWPNYLERRGLVMIMLERADVYGIFAGKIPAKNGVAALFEE